MTTNHTFDVAFIFRWVNGFFSAAEDQSQGTQLYLTMPYSNISPFLGILKAPYLHARGST